MGSEPSSDKENRLHPSFAYELQTRILAGDRKMDVMVHAKYGSDAIVYEARLNKRYLPEGVPSQFLDLRQLAKHLEDKQNHKYDFATRQLMVFFHSDVRTSSMEIDMTLNVAGIE